MSQMTWRSLLCALVACGFLATDAAASAPDKARIKRDLVGATVECGKGCQWKMPPWKQVVRFETMGGMSASHMASFTFRLWIVKQKPKELHQMRLGARYIKGPKGWTLEYFRQRHGKVVPMPPLFPTMEKKLKASSRPGKLIQLIGCYRDPRALPLLTPYLSHRKSWIRSYAARAIVLLGKKALPTLLELLKKKPSHGAILTLQRMGEDAVSAAPALIEAARRLSKDRAKWSALHRAAQALRAIGYLGPKARASLPGLRGFAKHPSVKVRSAAYKSMCRLRKSSKEGLALLRAMQKAGGDVQDVISPCAGWIGLPALPFLLKHLAAPRKSSDHRALVYQIVGLTARSRYGLKIPPAQAREVLAVLLKQSKSHPDPALRKSISSRFDSLIRSYTKSVGRFDLSAEYLHPVFFSKLRAIGSSWKSAKRGLFREYGLSDKAILDILGKACQRKDAKLCKGALKMAGALMTRAAPLLPLLEKLVVSKDKSLQRQASLATVRIGAASLPTLLKLLVAKDIPPKIRVDVAENIGIMGPKAFLHGAALRKALLDPRAGVQKATMEALSRMGLWAMVAHVELKQIATNPKHPLQARAVGILARYSTSLKPFLPVIRGFLFGKDEAAKRVALALLRKRGQIPSSLQAQIVAAKSGISRDALIKLYKRVSNPSPQALKRLIAMLPKKLSRSGSSEQHPRAVKAVLEALQGPDRKPVLPASLLPRLVALMTQKDAKGKHFTKVRQEGILLIGAMGPKAASAIPLIVEMSSSSEWFESSRAKDVLCALGEPAFPTIRSLLVIDQKPTKKVQEGRERALKLIACMKGKAGPLLPLLVKVAAKVEAILKANRTMDNGSVSLAADKALKSMPKAAVEKHWLPKFAAAPAAEQDVSVKMLAKHMKASALAALALKVLKDATISQQSHLLEAACKASPGAAKPWVEKILATKDKDARRIGYTCIKELPAKIRASYRSLLPKIMAELRDTKGEYVWYDAFGAGLILASNDGEFKQLFAAMDRRKEDGIKRSALHDIFHMKSRPAAVTKRLIKRALAGDLKSFAKFYVYQVGAMGKDGAPLIPRLLKLLRTPHASWNRYARSAAVRAMGRIGLPASVKNEALMPFLKDRRDSVQKEIATLLWRRGSRHPALLQQIKARLKMGDFYTSLRKEAVEELQKFKSNENLQWLLRLLLDGDHKVEKLAAQGLGKYKALPPSALSVFLTSLSWQQGDNPFYKERLSTPLLLKLAARFPATHQRATEVLAMGLLERKVENRMLAIKLLTKRKQHRDFYAPAATMLCRYAAPKVKQAACQLLKAK